MMFFLLVSIFDRRWKHRRFPTHILWEAFLTGLIIFKLLTPCVFFLLWSCVCGWWLQREEACFGLAHTRGRRRLVCKTQIKQPGWGIVPDRPLPLVNITSSAPFWTAPPQLHHFISVLKTQRSTGRASTFSSSRTKLKTLVKEHSDYIRSYVNSLESVKEIGRGVESYWPLA